MPGVRVQHATERNVRYTLVDGGRPYKAPYYCYACGRMHAFKTYHFSLDETGACIVSVEIAARLRRLHGHGFAIGNTVAQPPAQVIGHTPSRNGLAPIVVDPLLKEPL